MSRDTFPRSPEIDAKIYEEKIKGIYIICNKKQYPRIIEFHFKGILLPNQELVFNEI